MVVARLRFKACIDVVDKKIVKPLPQSHPGLSSHVTHPGPHNKFNNSSGHYGCVYIYNSNLVGLLIHIIQHYVLVLNGNISGKERVAGYYIRRFPSLVKARTWISKLSIARDHKVYCGLAART